MGQWLQVVRERPSNDRPTGEQIVGECYPVLLRHAFEAIWAGKRRDKDPSAIFPTLQRLETGPYEDEELWLTPDETVQLVDEFTRLRRICREEEFIPELDGRIVARCWRERDLWFRQRPPEELEQELDEIEALLWTALTGDCWVRIML